MYAQLGNIVFEGLVGPESFNRTNEASLAQHDLIDSKPRLQRTGSKLVLIDFDIKLHSMFCDPESEIRILNNWCENAEILPFINGNGENFGNFVISNISEAWMQTDAVGNIISVGLSISLIEYVAPDKLGQKNQAAKDGAFAKASNDPPKRKPFAQNQGEGYSIMKSNN